MSKFKEDLAKEAILGQFLDAVYQKLNLNFQRITDTNFQYKGIDLIYPQEGKDLYIDEKAQLNYLNKDLPTFTFELSYLKDNVLKQGWLFDAEKQTDYYFLVTAIYLDGNDLRNRNNIKTCKITSVNRPKLVEHLRLLGLTRAKLEFYNQELRKEQQFGQHLIEEIDPENGALHFTEYLAEKPINLKLKLEYLLDAKIAKRIFPVH